MKLDKIKRLSKSLLKANVRIDQSILKYKDKLANTREFCRQLIADNVITKVVPKGTTRHKVKKVKAMSRKTGYIQQVRKLRHIWKQLKKQKLVSNTVYRHAYVNIRARIIDTKKKLVQYINENTKT